MISTWNQFEGVKIIPISIAPTILSVELNEPGFICPLFDQNRMGVGRGLDLLRSRQIDFVRVCATKDRLDQMTTGCIRGICAASLRSL